MIFGRVTGTVVATRKDPKMNGFKLLLVQEADYKGNIIGGTKVAVDAVGAGIGELVLMVSGSSARQTDITDAKPTDATIMAIVDLVELKNKVVFDKKND